MPRYAFQCAACGCEFEVSRPMTDAGREARCPVDGEAAERIFSMPATIFGRARREDPVAPARARGYSHHGHHHGPGSAPHSH